MRIFGASNVLSIHGICSHRRSQNVAKISTYPSPGIVGDLELQAGADVLPWIEGVRSEAAALGLHDFAGVPLDPAVRLAHGHNEQVPHRMDGVLKRRHWRSDARRSS